MGGIGKTTLAVHAAHLVRDGFTDGQLYADLRGTQPLKSAPHDVIARFLRDLGVPASAVPGDEQERVLLYRSVLDGRRVLVVLDDADDAEQVRPLVPGSPGCAVVVTSRQSLPELPSSYTVELGSLRATEASDLFCSTIGARRAAAEPDATAAVLSACAGLPLAIRIAARRLARRPSWRVQTLADRLADERRRLDELSAGDLAVRASFLVSYCALGARAGTSRDASGPAASQRSTAARLFRLLSLAKGPTCGLAAASALAGQAPRVVEPALERLVDAQLLLAPGPARYRLHDLLRVYASEQVRAEEPEPERAAAVHRLLTWYLHSASAATRVVNPHRRHVKLDPAPPAGSPPEFGGYDEALGWLDEERENLVAAVHQAALCGRHEITWQLSLTMWDLFLLRGYHSDWVGTLQTGLRSTRILGNRYAESRILNDLAVAYDQTDRSAEAVEILHQGLAISRELGDRRGEAAKLANLGVSYGQLDRFDDAVTALRQALSIFQEIGYQAAQANTYNNLGWIEYRSGRPPLAIDHYRRAIEVSLLIGDEYSQAKALNGISEAYRRLDLIPEAIASASEAIVLNRKVGNRAEEANALVSLGLASGIGGDRAQARIHLAQALALLEESHDARAAQIRGELAALAGA
jgi:tetratricopeptide (TPR) repeat protein